MAASPFPGMDPFMEGDWLDVHCALTTYITDELNNLLPDALAARLSVREICENRGEPFRQPFIEIGEHDHHAVEILFQHLQKLLDLKAPLGRKQAEVGDDHAEIFASKGDVGIDGTARLPSGKTQIQFAHSLYLTAGQQHVAVMAVSPFEGGARYRLEAGHPSQKVHLVQLIRAIRFGMDFLEADNLCAAVGDNARDPARPPLAAANYFG